MKIKEIIRNNDNTIVAGERAGDWLVIGNVVLGGRHLESFRIVKLYIAPVKPAPEGDGVFSGAW